jgi:hypothetical protein
MTLYPLGVIFHFVTYRLIHCLLFGPQIASTPYTKCCGSGNYSERGGGYRIGLFVCIHGVSPEGGPYNPLKSFTIFTKAK